MTLLLALTGFNIAFAAPTAPGAPVGAGAPPPLAEICGDGIDNNSNGTVDEAVVAPTTVVVNDEVIPGNLAWKKCAPHVKVQVVGKETKDDRKDDKFVSVVKKMGKWSEAETTAALVCKIEIGGTESTFGSHTKISWNGKNAACPTGL